MYFTFDCELTQEAIDKEAERRKRWNETYIKSLMEKGEYGKEEERFIEVKYNEVFDNQQKFNAPLLSYKFILVD